MSDPTLLTLAFLPRLRLDFVEVAPEAGNARTGRFVASSIAAVVAPAARSREGQEDNEAR